MKSSQELRGRERGGSAGDNRARKGPRSWALSLAWGAVLVGIGVGLSASINPAFGRSVHWDWMAGLAPTLLVGITLALRRRWL